MVYIFYTFHTLILMGYRKVKDNQKLSVILTQWQPGHDPYISPYFLTVYIEITVMVYLVWKKNP